MINQRKILIIVTLLAVLMSLTLSAALAQDPEQGQTVWTEEELCRRCHGDAAEGGWAGSLAGTDVTLEELTEQVRNGGRAMPAFSEDKVADEQLADIHAYLTSLEVVNTPTRNSFELADDAHPGQALIVQKRCIACHGPTGPVGNFNRRAEEPTAEAVIRQLRNPRMNMPMFREDQVSDEEAATIAEFLAAQYEPALQAPPSALDKALNALGGQEALQNLTAFSAESQGMRWTIDEQFLPGASAGPAGAFSLQIVYDVAGGNVRLDYTRQGGAGERQISEIIAGDVGYLDGQDAAFGAPGSVAMTSDRWASTLKQQRLLNPHLLLRELDPATVSDGGERIFNGTVHHRLVIAADVAPITLYVDAGTGQISKLETVENDHLRRDVPVEVFYYGWQPLGGGVSFPAEIYLALDGEIVHKEVRTALSVNPEVDSTLFDAPEGVTAEFDEDLAMRGALSGEFNQLFAASGFIKDGAQTAINAEEIAPGVFLLGGVANNSMVVEQEEGIVVLEAPLHQYRSQAVIDWVTAEFPDKPITHVTSSHHHTDHSAGLRTYVAQGATVVVGEAAADYFAGIFQAASTVLPDALAENPVAATIEPVPSDGSVTIDDATNPVVVYPIANTHAADMVIVYVGGEAGVVFVSDLYSPNPAATSAGAGGQLLYERITELGLEVSAIAGGHGGSISFEDFEGILE